MILIDFHWVPTTYLFYDNISTHFTHQSIRYVESTKYFMTEKLIILKLSTGIVPNLVTLGTLVVEICFMLFLMMEVYARLH